MYGVIVSESSMNKYNIFADLLCFEIKNRRQGPKTAGYRRKPAAISNPAGDLSGLVDEVRQRKSSFFHNPSGLSINDAIKVDNPSGLNL
jgi:hypothetical protein